MENFIVSARKYRPQTFDTVVGQAPISFTLKNAIRSNHVAQAYLFCGPRGVGKTTCARILAKTINCFKCTKNIEACDECESCKSFNSGHSLNIYELDAASNNSVDDIRNLINQVSFAPQIGSHKVYIIDEVHMLSQQAFNAFLKTLEEPPKHAIFILATTEKHKIIPTILSRCQIFDFNRIKIEDTVAHLAAIAKKEKVKAEEDALHIIAQKSDGAMRDALSIFDQMVSLTGDSITYKNVIDNLSILDYDYYFKVTDALLEKNTSSSLLIFNEILNKGFDGHNFLNGLAEHLRNLLVCRDESTLQLMEVSASIRERYKTQSKKTVPIAIGIDFLLRGLNMLNKADVQYKTSRNQRLLVELTLLQLCSLQDAGTGSSVEKKSEFLDKPNGETAENPYTVPASVSKTATESIPVLKTDPPVTSVSSPAANPGKNSTSKSPIKSLLSISSLTNGNGSSFTVKEQKAEYKTSSNSGSSESVSLESAWNNFAESLKNKKKVNLASTLTARKPVQKDESIITFSVLNQVQEDEINAIKTELLTFLRSEMRTSSLQLKIIVDKNEGERKPYTGEEKYQRLAEKNPAIAKLRQQFNLEIDF
ncbi:MAG: DNA polymerase III subunit gamma/tau [Bacteroidetes bacterium]|nr:MAG: DNA polymerase III subunit gamma/tau [Bacteroidota bacterium]